MSKEKTKEFKVGNVVAIKTGGTKMTVMKVNESGEVGCAWFVEDKLYEDAFLPETLIFVAE